MPFVHNRLDDEVIPATIGIGVTVYALDVPLALVGQAPAKLTVRLYAPVALAVGLKDGDTLVELVVAAIPGPDQLYVGVPTAAVTVAVSVMVAPAQIGLVAEDVSAVTVGCVPIETVVVYIIPGLQPMRPVPSLTVNE